VNGNNSTEIARLKNSLGNVLGESNCLVQGKHDLLRKCGDEPWLIGVFGQTVLNGLDAPLGPFKVALMTTFIP